MIDEKVMIAELINRRLNKHDCGAPICFSNLEECAEAILSELKLKGWKKDLV